MTGPVLLIDGNNMAMRAIYASRHSHMEAAGINTGPLTTYMASLTRIVAEVKPSYVAVAWDGGSSMRKQLIAGYKAHRHEPPDVSDLRNDSFTLIHQIHSFLEIYELKINDYEADDLIAAWWNRLTPETATEIVIASSDKDFLQLLGPNPNGIETRVIRLSSANTPTDVWTAELFESLQGYKPSYWPLVTALTGDSADGVPGIPGVGPMRAQKLLEEYDWSFVQAVRAKYPEHLLQVQDNLLAVNLRVQNQRAPVEDIPPFRGYLEITPQFQQWLDHYGFVALKGKIVTGKLWGPPKLPGRPFQLKLPLDEPGA